MAEKQTIKFALLCDDVRREDNGKLQFLGIYEQDIVLGQIPGTIGLRLVIFVDANSTEKMSMEVRFELDKEKLMEGRADLTILKKGIVMLPLPAVPITFQHKGTLKVSANIEGKGWKEIWTGVIHQRETAQSPPVTPPALS